MGGWKCRCDDELIKAPHMNPASQSIHRAQTCAQICAQTCDQISRTDLLDCTNYSFGDEQCVM